MYALQLFYSFFKTLIGKEIAVELKNDVALMGTLHSVDQYLNIKLLSVSVVEGDKFPQLVRLSSALQNAAMRACVDVLLTLVYISSFVCVLIVLQMNMKNCFVRGSSIRYVQIPASEVDTELLQDATRREANANKQS